MSAANVISIGLFLTALATCGGESSAPARQPSIERIQPSATFAQSATNREGQDNRSSADAGQTQSTLLDIAARDQAPEKPSAGWCAETAIQEALLHYGAFVPQRAINRAGRPRHPDLYWGDVPRALRGVGLSFEKWPGESTERSGNERGGREGFGDFVAWLEEQIRDGRPVVSGVKIYPTEHPRWGLDHIVLIVGFEESRALHINTTWGSRRRMTHARLQASKEGISLHNRYGQYYAYAITGPRHTPKGSVPVRLSVRRETRGHLEADVIVDQLVPGEKYRLMKYELGQEEPVETTEIVSKAKRQVFRKRLDKSRSAIYRCVAG